MIAVLLMLLVFASPHACQPHPFAGADVHLENTGHYEPVPPAGKNARDREAAPAAKPVTCPTITFNTSTTVKTADLVRTVYDVRKSGSLACAYGATVRYTLYGISQFVLNQGYDIHQNNASWMAFFKRRDLVCKAPRATVGMLCSYACASTEYEHCEDHYSPGIAYGILLNVTRSADRHTADDTAVAETNYAVWFDTLMTAIISYWPQLAFAMCNVVAAAKPSNDYVRFAAVFIAFVTATLGGQYFQSGLSILIGFAPRVASTPYNVNNVALSMAAVVTYFAIIFVDVSDDPVTSLVTLLIIGALYAAAFTSIVRKAFAVDVVTYLTIMSIGISIASTLSVVMETKGDTDVFIAAMSFYYKATMPHMAERNYYIFKLLTAVRRVTGVTVTALPELMRYNGAVSMCYLVTGLATFCLARALVGYSVMRNARDIPINERLFRGFLLVWLDIPVFSDLASLFYASARRERNIPYIMIVSVLKLYELLYAQDIFALSVAVALLCSIFDYKPFTGAKKLSLLSITAPGEYRCMDSMPWLDTDMLSAVQRAVVRVHYQTATGMAMGCGMLLRAGTSTYLWTVAHVGAVGGIISDRNGVAVGEITEQLPPVTDRVDPITPYVVRMNADTDIIPPDISVLTAAEVDSVAGNVFVHADKAFTFPKSVHFDNVASEARVAVDATHGDSGTPMFAFMKSGAMRYAGAISRGVADIGSPNYVSTVLKSTRMDMIGENTPMGKVSPSVIDAIKRVGVGKKVSFVRGGKQRSGASTPSNTDSGTDDDRDVVREYFIQAKPEHVLAAGNARLDGVDLGASDIGAITLAGQAGIVPTEIVERAINAIKAGRIARFNFERAGYIGGHPGLGSMAAVERRGRGRGGRGSGGAGGSRGRGGGRIPEPDVGAQRGRGEGAWRRPAPPQGAAVAAAVNAIEAGGGGMVGAAGAVAPA